ncbi:ribonuclease III [Singulisphaera sp. PoT]|uniref:ribonuclease III n=1 Tax=Singulisphaera sp. PoT TaxID=3411797 RepID=UPI003BF483BE
MATQLLGRHVGANMPDPNPRDEATQLEHCQEVLKYRFRDATYLREALTHASGANHRLVSNERLEFLGDAILGAIVCELLFRKFPEYLEGDLTRIKSVVVSRRTCAKISQRLGLDEFLVLGKGMGGQEETPSSALADVFESLIGAIYLDGGMAAAQSFILRHIEAEIDATVGGQGGINYKSNLQQVAQRQFGETPTYHLLDEKGPDHSKCFKISAQIGTLRYAPAWGRNKKDAEQRAAMNALSQLSGEAVPFESD